MSCYHPLDVYISDRFHHPKTGKGKVCFLKFDDEVYRTPDGSLNFLDINLNTGEIVHPFKIPCGQCVGCRLDYSRQWANRCVLESLTYDEDLSWFLTLTYDDDHVPVSYPVMRGGSFDNPVDLDSPVLTLKSKDLQDFLKRLRITYQRKFDHVGIRFYACGEYGDRTARPHYHCIAFNLPIHDLTYYGKNRQGDALFISDLLTEIWGHGYVVVGQCTWKTCAYTARYVMKKAKGKEACAKFALSGLDQEFVRMSRNPGIGVPYFEKHIDDIYRNVAVDGSDLLIPSGKIQLPNGIVASSCRLFDEKYSNIDLDHALGVALMRSHRKSMAEASAHARARSTDLSDEEYFSLQECEKQKIAKYLQGIL